MGDRLSRCCCERCFYLATDFTIDLHDLVTVNHYASRSVYEFDLSEQTGFGFQRGGVDVIKRARLNYSGAVTLAAIFDGVIPADETEAITAYDAAPKFSNLAQLLALLPSSGVPNVIFITDYPTPTATNVFFAVSRRDLEIEPSDSAVDWRNDFNRLAEGKYETKTPILMTDCVIDASGLVPSVYSDATKEFTFKMIDRSGMSDVDVFEAAYSTVTAASSPTFADLPTTSVMGAVPGKGTISTCAIAYPSADGFTKYFRSIGSAGEIWHGRVASGALQPNTFFSGDTSNSSKVATISPFLFVMRSRGVEFGGGYVRFSSPFTMSSKTTHFATDLTGKELYFQFEITEGTTYAAAIILKRIFNDEDKLQSNCPLQTLTQPYNPSYSQLDYTVASLSLDSDPYDVQYTASFGCQTAAWETASQLKNSGTSFCYSVIGVTEIATLEITSLSDAEPGQVVLSDPRLKDAHNNDCMLFTWNVTTWEYVGQTAIVPLGSHPTGTYLTSLLDLLGDGGDMWYSIGSQVYSIDASGVSTLRVRADFVKARTSMLVAVGVKNSYGGSYTYDTQEVESWDQGESPPTLSVSISATEGSYILSVNGK